MGSEMCIRDSSLCLQLLVYAVYLWFGVSGRVVVAALLFCAGGVSLRSLVRGASGFRLPPNSSWLVPVGRVLMVAWVIPGSIPLFMVSLDGNGGCPMLKWARCLGAPSSCFPFGRATPSSRSRPRPLKHLSAPSLALLNCSPFLFFLESDCRWPLFL